MKSKKKEKIKVIFERWGFLVDSKIKEILNFSIDRKFQELINYQITTGGKRLRPALAIASCLACGGKIKDVLYPAAGLEILHNCTLIYDDIIDNSSLRRGQPTVWFKFGKSIAECIGIDYAAAVFQAANKSKKPFEISEIFAQTMKTVMEGEIFDILFEQAGRKSEKYITANRYHEITKQDYLAMINKKTASLIQACCQVGALSASASQTEIAALKDFGFNLGIAFQARDDVLDVFGDEKKFGKKIGKDIQERKLGNLVIFYALEEIGPSQKKKELLTILRKNQIKDQDIKKAVKLISQTKAKEKALLLEQKYTEKAKKNLEALPKNKWSDFLNEIADFTIVRNK